MTQTAYDLEINVFLFKLPYYFEIYRTVMEIFEKKIITIIDKCQK